MEIIFKKQARKYYDKAPKNLQKKFDEAIENITKAKGDITELEGQPGIFRYKFFGYRILYFIDTEEVAIHILRIAPRGDAYK